MTSIPPLYQVSDWNEHFESAKSRLIQRCANTYAPNKHGGSGWSNVMGEQDGAAIWGIWKMLLDICSRQARPREGWLTADGKKTGRRLSARELSNQLRRPIDEIHSALRTLRSPEVAFVKLVEGYPEDMPLAAQGPSADTREPAAGRIAREHLEDTTPPSEYPSGVLQPDIQRRIEEQKESLSKGAKNGEQPDDTSPTAQGQAEDTGGIPDVVQHAEAKLILGKLARAVFPDEAPGAIWDNKLEHELDEVLPLRRTVLEKVDWAYRLRPDHRLFQDKGGGGMMRRRSFASLIPNLKSEASKIADARKKIGLNGMGAIADCGNRKPDREEEEWTPARRSAAVALYGAVTFPEKFSQMQASCRVEIEKKAAEVQA